MNTLMAMPSAKGLFHRAITESGSMLRAVKPENSAKLAAAVLAELGLNAGQVDTLQLIPPARLVRPGNTGWACK